LVVIIIIYSLSALPSIALDRPSLTELLQAQFAEEVQKTLILCFTKLTKTNKAHI